MAARQGQGLQIAVISFAMLTIILAITTYIFYAQAQTSDKDLQAKTKALNDKQAENAKLMYKVRAMQYVLGQKGVGMPEVDVAKSAAGGDDPEVKEILDTFNNDVALVGEPAGAEGARSYSKLVSALMTTINKKNASVADAIQQSRDAQKQKDEAEAAANARAVAAETASKTAVEDYAKQGQEFVAARAKMDEEKNTLASQITTTVANSKTAVQKVNEEKDAFIKVNTQLTTVNKTQAETIKKFEKEKASLFESPDGHIKFVNQNLRTVWIDVGRTDGLIRQTTFSVFDHDENGVSNAKSKGRIEVVSMDDHLAEARILEDTPRNPIITGDVIFTPAWSPGQRVHFALAMKMDINKDGTDDYDTVKRIIEMNGGVIDAELRPDGKRVGDINVNTRYFVQGEKLNEATSQEMQKQFTAFDLERDRFGVEKIPVEKLLSLMGWKPEVRTVELAGPRDHGEFRTRRPGKTQPAATNGGAAAPASEAAPAASPGAPAAPAADPFAAPAAPPARAPAAPPADDPFAAPTPR